MSLWSRNKKEDVLKPRYEGLKVLYINVAGAAAGGDGCIFVLHNFIKIHGWYVQNAGFIFFPELQSARNTNSIFASITNGTNSVATVNNNVSCLYFQGWVNLPKPIVVKQIEQRQNTTIACNVTYYYEDYAP